MTDILTKIADLEEKAFAPGEILIPEGGQGGDLFFLIEGKVAIDKGDVRMFTVGKPGSVFGEMASLLDRPYSATVSAVTDVRAFYSPDGPDLLANRPDIALHTARILSRRLFAATSYLADLKSQFSDHENHFGMMDRILEALLLRQDHGTEEPAKVSQASDPRL
ncbi:MAG: cyclic nucleotide-binding domain-containing protein [Pseudomonadota bacterium]